MREKYKLLVMIVIFILLYFLKFDTFLSKTVLLEGFLMLQEYVREHVLLCLIPAFFIAGAISVFVSQTSVIKYFGPNANKLLSYTVASVSGTILAVCSCTVLPIFAGIFKNGAGIGPAITFLYSGPAINVLAIILTTRVLGFEIGLARTIGAIVFAIVIGLIMSFIYRDEKRDVSKNNFVSDLDKELRPLWKTTIYFFNLVLILIFATWGNPQDSVGFYSLIYKVHWYLTVGLLISLFFILKFWFNKEELSSWIIASWTFAKQIFPLLLIGVFVAGILMGRPGHDNGLIADKYISMLVGGNSFRSNMFASISGALMYFATLTEIPILQGLIGSGMGKGPSLALLLSGPALSLPSMIVLSKIVGTKKMLVYVILVALMSAVVGLIYGKYF